MAFGVVMHIEMGSVKDLCGSGRGSISHGHILIVPRELYTALYNEAHRRRCHHQSLGRNVWFCHRAIPDKSTTT